MEFNLVILKRIVLLLLVLWSCGNSHTSSKAKQSPATAISQDFPKNNKELQNGDLIFQTSLSNQSMAIQIATNSKYSHMGIIYQEGADFFVYEAVQPVKLTPLAEWIRRGENGSYVVKRLKNSEANLTPERIAQMKTVGKKYLGKDYDLKFAWSDDKIYCSELVWKIYKEVFHVEIGELQRIKDFDLSDPRVQAKVKERYGDSVPMEELIITPDRMFKSDLLLSVLNVE